jgi:hypothetical protein
MYHRGLSLAILISTLLSFLILPTLSCKKKNRSRSAAAAPEELFEAEPWPQTKELTPAMLTEMISYAEESGTLTFAADSEYAKNLKQHDVIIGGISEQTPKGLLRLVDSIESAEGGIVVKTSWAPIQLAYQKLRIRTSRKIEQFSDLDKKRLGLDGASGALTLDWFAFNGDGDPATKEDQVHVQGTLGGSLEFFLGFEFDWSLVKIRPIPPFVDVELPEVKVGLTLSAAAQAQLQFDGVAAQAFERSDTIWSYPLEPISFPPLVFFPEVELRSTLSGGASSSFQLGVSESFNGGVDVSFSTTSGGKATVTPPQITHETPTVTVKGTALGKAEIGPRLVIRLYGVAGPYATLGAFTKIEANRDSTPCWNASGGFGGDVGFDISVPILGKRVNLVDWSTPVTLAEAGFGSGSCDLSSSSTIAGGNSSEEPLFTPWSRVYRDHFTFPAEFITATHGADGNLVIAGSAAKALTKVDPRQQGKLIWSRKFITASPAGITETGHSFQNALYLKKGAGHLVATVAPNTLTKLTEAGKVEWSQMFEAGLSTNPNDQFRALAADAGDSAYLGGYYAVDQDKNDFWLAKFAADGEMLWQKRGSVHDQEERITGTIMLGDGIVILGQSRIHKPAPQWVSWIMRLDFEGQLQWARKVDGCGENSQVLLTGGTLSHDGDVLITGSVDYLSFNARALVMKLKKEGALGFATGFGVKEGAQSIGLNAAALVQAPSGALFVTGNTFAIASDKERLFVARTDAVGRPAWLSRYQGVSTEPAYHEGRSHMVASFADNGIIVTGSTPHGRQNLEGDSLWLLKLPIKTGALDFNAASGATRADHTAQTVSPECTTLTEVTVKLEDAAVKLTPVTTTLHAYDVKTLDLAP